MHTRACNTHTSAEHYLNLIKACSVLVGAMTPSILTLSPLDLEVLYEKDCIFLTVEP